MAGTEPSDDPAGDADLEGIRAGFADVVESVWASIVGLELGPEESTDIDAVRTGGMTAVLQINGAWEGAVTVETSEALAEQVACTMLGIDSDDLDGEILADAIGELTNILCGNLKVMLPAPSSIGLPAVVEGTELMDDVPGVTVACRLAFRCGHERLAVALLVRT